MPEQDTANSPETKAQHTPGPWSWFNYPDGRKLLAATNRAVIHCPDAPLSIESADQQLIAAAPDLCAALKTAIDTIRALHSIGPGAAEEEMWRLYQQSPEMRVINAALAKVEGR